MLKNIYNFLFNFVIFILVFYIIQWFTFNLFVDNLWKLIWNTMLVTNKNVNIIWTNKNWDKEVWKVITNNVDTNTKKFENIDYLQIWNKKFIVRKDKWENLIWANFISYKTIDWHYYLYAHNWPWVNYFIWNYINSKTKIWDIISITDLSNWITEKYKLYNIEEVNQNITKNNWKIKFKNSSDLLFFTCVNDWQKRKIFLFEKINNNDK